jgi:hypothetical protein
MGPNQAGLSTRPIDRATSMVRTVQLSARAIRHGFGGPVLPGFVLDFQKTWEPG